MRVKIRFPAPRWAGTGRGLVSATVGGVTGAGLLAPGVGVLARSYAESLGWDPDVAAVAGIAVIAWVGSLVGCRTALRAYHHGAVGRTLGLLALAGPFFVGLVVWLAPDEPVGVAAMVAAVLTAPLVARLLATRGRDGVSRR